MTTKSQAGSWLLVLAICAAIVGASFWMKKNPSEAAKAAIVVPRTAQLARKKQASLETYNDEISVDEIVSFYQNHTAKKFSPEAFEHLEELIRENALRKLWVKASEESKDLTVVSHRTMVDELQRYFPHEVLTNADVVLFPNDSRLRIIVAEAASDFFRDTARHWRWIADFADGSSNDSAPDRFLELDSYAAEELSEFLSVLAVGVVELAAADSEDGQVTAAMLDTVFDKVANQVDDIRQPRDSTVGYSDIAKNQIGNSLPSVLFKDVTLDANIDFTHRPKQEFQERRSELAIPLGIAGGGVAANDFNGDGVTDLYFGGDKGGVLYIGGGNGEFENVTKTTGIETNKETRAGYFVDFDNDGDNDLFVTCVGAPNALFENDGTGNFQDVSESIGLLQDEFTSHEAVWFDMNNDGLLDLYVANFGNWLSGESPTLGRFNTNGHPNRLYRHELKDGKHLLVEVGEELGVDDRGWTHCAGVVDIDKDGWLDLLSINDFGASQVFRNLNGQAFEEVSKEAHLDDIYNGMSFTLLDLNHDSNFSIYISQIMKLTHRQRYRRPTEDTKMEFDPDKKDNLRVLVANRLFTRAFESRFRDDHNYMIEPANLGWSWDVSGLDYENDADLDLLVLNGTESATPTSTTRDREVMKGRNYLGKFNYEQNVFFVQDSGYFYDWSDKNPVAFYGNSRGSAFFDFDNDGDLDVLISNYYGSPKVFENLQESNNNWFRLKLEGTRSNRNAIGAVVEVVFGDKRRYGIVVSGSGFLSQDPYTLHFGLGQADSIDSVKVTWPSGISQDVTDGIKLNQLNAVTEDESSTPPSSANE